MVSHAHVEFVAIANANRNIHNIHAEAHADTHMHGDDYSDDDDDVVQEYI